MIAVGTITASDVPLATTGDNPSTSIIAGTITTPPPIPSKPASTPATIPVATSAAAEPTESACSLDVSSSNNSRAADATNNTANDNDSKRFGARANHAVPMSVPASEPIVSAIAAPAFTWSLAM